MKPLEVRVPHNLGRDEIRRRLDEAAVRARTEYAGSISQLQTTWDGDDRLGIFLVVKGMKFNGEIEVRTNELVAKLHVPMLASLFAGTIRSGIEDQLGKLVVP